MAMRLYRWGLLFAAIIFSVLFAACGEEQTPEAEEPEEEVVEEPEEESLPETLTDSAGIEYRLVPAGTFVMGYDEGNDNERPAHTVTISRPFYMSVHEISKELYYEVMVDTEFAEPTEVVDPYLPATNMTWHEAMEFCHKLALVENAEYRLPTEAEWEYAYRAGSETAFYWGDDFDAEAMAEPNAFGLSAMANGVSEWCLDWYVPYSDGDQTDPVVEEQVEKLKAVRGGHDGPGTIPSSFTHYSRGFADPDHDFYDTIGFRVVRMVK